MAEKLNTEQRKIVAAACGWPENNSWVWEPKEWRSQHVALIRKLAELAVKTGNAATCVNALKLMAVTGSHDAKESMCFELLEQTGIPLEGR